jgi:hypothetical protein
MRITTGVVLWLVAAAAATAVGLFAVGAIGTDIFGPGTGQPLSQSEVDQQVAETPATTTTTSPSPATSPSSTSSSSPAAGRTHSVRSAGGTVWARCVPGGVEVVGATPAQGFQTEPDDDGIDDHPKVTFVAGEREIEIRLRCAGGTITHTVEEKD